MTNLELGSYGCVAKCKEKESKKFFAIKFLEIQSKGNAIHSVVNEINILRDSMECPYIVEYVLFLFFETIQVFCLKIFWMLHERQHVDGEQDLFGEFG